MGGQGSGGRSDPKRQRLAAQLRAQGLTLAEIGKRLSITHQGARHLLHADEINAKRRARWAKGRKPKKTK